MTAGQILFLLFTLTGGLALFILGMNIMTEGLRSAVGAKLQRLLSKTTRNKISGLSLGTVLGATIHSGPTIVMLLGFINAGLMTLEQSIAPMMGANVGTTLSMQAVSFKISDYCYVAITAGLILSLASRHGKWKDIGRAILGFGLLFLGMNTMSGAITPHKEVLSVYLQGINGSTLSGVLIGVAVSTLLTAIWQSSGATIAIIFALVSAGVFTQFSQVFPIVLGAHIGTCTTAILSSFGTNVEARRSAISHLLFNVGNVLLAILLMKVFYYVIPLTSSDLIRQTANLHTAVMLLPALLLLPFTGYFAKIVRILLPSKKPLPEPSHLDYRLLEFPESAIVAVISELQRVAKLCARSLHLTARVILHQYDKETVIQIKMNEQVIDDIKLAMREYLLSLTEKYLSRRQIVMSSHLNRCMTDIERIGDHIDELCDLSLKRPHSVLDKESFDNLFSLYVRTKKLLGLVIQSLRADHPNFQEAAMAILSARDEYIQSSIETNQKFMQKVERHEITSIAALYFKDYISVLDRMIRHIESIALAQKHEDFWIKRTKLDKKPDKVEPQNVYSVDPTDYLDKLQSEDYL